MQVFITDTSVEKLHPTDKVARDTKIPGFIVRVGKRAKTFRFETETTAPGVRRGNGTRKVLSRKLGVFPYMKAEKARAAALEIAASLARGIEPPKPSGITLGAAHADYIKHLEAKRRSRQWMSSN